MTRAFRLPGGRLLFLGLALLSAAAARDAGAQQDALAAVRSQLTTSRAALIAGIDKAKAHTDDPYDLVTRFDQALSGLDAAAAANDPAYAREAMTEALLDKALVDQVLAGSCRPPATSPGTQETCVVSSRDGTLQPVAVVVPQLSALQSAPIVVLLRGRGQTESNLASLRQVRELADATGAIVAVPYARGRVIYDALATQDVLDATAAVVSAFGAEPKRVYLAGFSAGGIAAFHVAAEDPKRYAAVLSIGGALRVEDRDAAGGALRGRRVYIVAGSDDAVVPTNASRAAAQYLHAQGSDVGYYEQSRGTHSLQSLYPSVETAWADMLAGKRGRFDLEAQPTPPAAPEVMMTAVPSTRP